MAEVMSQEVTSLFTFVAKAEKKAEKSFVSIEVPCNQNDPGKQVPEDSICLAKKGT